MRGVVERAAVVKSSGGEDFRGRAKRRVSRGLGPQDQYVVRRGKSPDPPVHLQSPPVSTHFRTSFCRRVVRHVTIHRILSNVNRCILTRHASLHRNIDSAGQYSDAAKTINYSPAPSESELIPLQDETDFGTSIKTNKTFSIHYSTSFPINI